MVVRYADPWAMRRLNNIVTSLEEIGVSLIHFMELVQDGDPWITLVNIAFNLRFLTPYNYLISQIPHEKVKYRSTDNTKIGNEGEKSYRKNEENFE